MSLENIGMLTKLNVTTYATRALKTELLTMADIREVRTYKRRANAECEGGRLRRP